LLEKGIKEFGRSYAGIQSKYFSKCSPPVTREQIQNFIRKTPHLSQLAGLGAFLSCSLSHLLEHKTLKENAYVKFQSEVNGLPNPTNNCSTTSSNAIHRSNTEMVPFDHSKNESISYADVKYPTDFGPIVVVPNRSFLYTPPFLPNWWIDTPTSSA
jgi:hypothetical protein